MDKVKIWCALLFVMVLSSSEILFAAPVYVLDSEKSSLFFVSTKNTHVVENHHFSDLSGAISDLGVAELTINLSSVETAIDKRNQRVRDILFEVATFSEAVVTLNVDIDSLAVQDDGSSQTQLISATLNLHGVSSEIETNVVVTKLSDSSVLVQSASPILISAGDFNLSSGVDALRDVAKLDVISYAVPVNFMLIFNTSSQGVAE